MKEILAEGPGWQDWSAALASMPDVMRRIRVYLVGKAATPGERRTIQRAGEREFQLLEPPGIFRARGRAGKGESRISGSRVRAKGARELIASLSESNGGPKYGYHGPFHP